MALLRDGGGDGGTVEGRGGGGTVVFVKGQNEGVGRFCLRLQKALNCRRGSMLCGKALKCSGGSEMLEALKCKGGSKAWRSSLTMAATVCICANHSGNRGRK